MKKLFWSIEIDKPFPEEKTLGKFGSSKKSNRAKLIFWSKLDSHFGKQKRSKERQDNSELMESRIAKKQRRTFLVWKDPLIAN